MPEPDPLPRLQPNPEVPASPCPASPPRHDPEGASPARVPDHGWQRRELVIWGALGGTGTSTLAVWLQPA